MGHTTHTVLPPSEICFSQGFGLCRKDTTSFCANQFVSIPYLLVSDSDRSSSTSYEKQKILKFKYTMHSHHLLIATDKLEDRYGVLCVCPGGR